MSPTQGRIPPGVRAVVFDAVGTLLGLDPPAADVYADFGARFGSRLAREEIRRRFADAFAAQERLDAGRGHRSDEQREAQRWRQIVAEVLDDVPDAAGVFQALYDHFARPAAWKADADAGVIDALKARGLVVGMASNFDHRLRGIVAGTPALGRLDHLWISSEVGWKKPSPEFFARVGATLAMRPDEVLLVGDDLDNDFRGARAAGLHALLYDPRRRSKLADGDRLDRLADLVETGQARGAAVDR